jgi:predicted nucleic acid-binding protein
MGKVSERVFLDAGVFIGAFLAGDPRHEEARPIVESVRGGQLPGCTSAGVLCEVYASLTWQQACPRHEPEEAAQAVWLLVEPPSDLVVIDCGCDAVQAMLALAVAHSLRARDVHDARHAAVALTAGVSKVLTYDVKHWQRFVPDGLAVVGPPSVLSS